MTAARLLAILLSGLSLCACQSGPQPAYPQNPTDSGSSYSNFSLPSSQRGMQDTDLED